MIRFLNWATIGLLGGTVSGLIAFETIAVLFFALAQYGRYSFAEGALIGIITGAAFGPVFALLRTPWWKAAAWEAGILGVLYMGSLAGMMRSGLLVYTYEGEAIRSLVWSMVSMSMASASAGACTAWTVAWLRQYEVHVTPPRPQDLSPANRERRYRL